MFKNLLVNLLILTVIVAAGAVGYVTLYPTLHMAPPVTKLTPACEVAEGVAYRLIVSQINLADAVDLHREIRDLKRMGVKEVQFYINSPGGSFMDAKAVHDAIKRMSDEGIRTIAHIEGCCLSAAVLIASACDYRVAGPNCSFMVHRVHGGDPDILEIMCKEYTEILSGNTLLTAEEWMEKLNAPKGTWFGPEEALEWGLVDEIK